MSPQPTSTREDSRTKKKKKKKEAPEDGASDVALLKKNFLCPNPKINCFQKNFHSTLQIVPVYVLPAAETVTSPDVTFLAL